MRHRKGTFKPASARSKKAALAASREQSGELVQEFTEEAVVAHLGTCSPKPGVWSDFSQERWGE
jgi:hypothetical protein